MKLPRHPFSGFCALLLLLLLAGAEQHVFEVSIWPANPVVEYGGSLGLNCSTSCQEADAKGSLETSLIKARKDNGTGWARFQLVNITEWASAVECSFSCYGEHKSVRANILVYQIPERVAWDPVPMMEVGKLYNLTCRVAKVAPLQNLTVTLRKGKENLHVETFESHGTLEATDIVVTHIITAEKEDHGEEATCHAALDLRPDGHLFEKASLGKVLKVYDFAMDPQLHTLHYMEANSSTTVQCDVVGAFPAEEAQFDLTFAEEKLNFSISALDDTMRAQVQLSPFATGNHVLNCTVVLGPVTKSAVETVHVYNVPEMDDSTCPSNHTWVEGTWQALRCRAKGNPKPTVTCSQEGLLHHDLEKEKQVTRSLAGIYNCTAVNEFGSSIRTVAIHVEYGPELGESDCPSNQTWLEGTLQKLRCQAEGLPIPDVSCMKDGKVLDTRRVQNVTQSHAGVYLCNVSNAHGSRSKMVTVRVEYKPDMDDSSCPYNWMWTVGAEQMFTCFAWGNPEPTVECMKDGISYSSPGVLHIVTRDYAGTYLCIAKNRHGSSTRTVSIQVEYKPEMDDSSCPSHWTLVEGAPFTFACKAEGLPPPEVVCSKDGISYHFSQGQGIPVDNGTFWCSATNSHGTVAKSVTVVVETKPKIDESTCPSNQTWLEGTLQSLTCKANGSPTPLVSCAKEGAAQEYYSIQNVSRNDSGIYQCQAINSHGTKRWMVNVQVEYRPVISILSVSASLPIRRGENFSITCHADGSPQASFSWRVPQAPNLSYLGNNSTVAIVGADGHNSGVYECTASNKHGKQQSQVDIHVEDHWLYIIVIIAIAGATMLVLGGMAGVIYYLKSTACKKGEYNVRDAENSTEATCLNRERPCDSDIYGIQLTRT